WVHVPAGSGSGAVRYFSTGLPAGPVRTPNVSLRSYLSPSCHWAFAGNTVSWPWRMQPSRSVPPGGHGAASGRTQASHVKPGSDPMRKNGDAGTFTYEPE